MGKAQDSKKETKKAPALSKKEKKDAKRAKKASKGCAGRLAADTAPP
jgi:hypothetical protein